MGTESYFLKKVKGAKRVGTNPKNGAARFADSGFHCPYCGKTVKSLISHLAESH